MISKLLRKDLDNIVYIHSKRFDKNTYWKRSMSRVAAVIVANDRCYKILFIIRGHLRLSHADFDPANLHSVRLYRCQLYNVIAIVMKNTTLYIYKLRVMLN